MGYGRMLVRGLGHIIDPNLTTVSPLQKKMREKAAAERAAVMPVQLLPEIVGEPEPVRSADYEHLEDLDPQHESLRFNDDDSSSRWAQRARMARKRCRGQKPRYKDVCRSRCAS